MDEIETEKKKSMLNIIIRWVFGIFFLIMCLGVIIGHGYIAGLLFLLAAIIAIPPAATELEKKTNVQMSGIVRFFVVFILMAVAMAATPTTHVAANNNTTAIAAPPSAVSGSDALVVVSTDLLPEVI